MLIPDVCAERKAKQERSGRITTQPRNMSYLQRASSRRTVQGWVFMALQLCRLLCLVHAAGGGFYLSLNMEESATICRGSTSWVRRDCQVSLHWITTMQTLLSLIWPFVFASVFLIPVALTDACHGLDTGPVYWTF